MSGFSRWFGAALLVVASIQQVGCGVLHCVERQSERSAPPCHEESDSGSSSHAPGQGEEGCCQVVTLEPANGASLHATPVLFAVFVAAAGDRVPSARVVLDGRVDTGPPVPRGISHPVPLRI